MPQSNCRHQAHPYPHAPPPPCFVAKHPFSLKPPQIKANAITTTTTRHHNQPYPQPVTARPRATLPPQTLLENVASKYLNVDVFDQQSQQAPHARPEPLNPVIIIPGYGATAKQYQPMAQLLREALGPAASVSVVPVTLSTWVSTVGGRPITPVLHLLHRTVQQATQQSGASNVQLVAHSAGGWIARIYLGDTPYPTGSSLVWNGARFVSKLICLGTPHRSDEGVTKKNMQFVNDNYPGAYHAHVQYVNIVGNGCSVPQQRSGAWRFWEPGWFPRVSYRITDKSIGSDAAQGDGIVPLSSAFLSGAHNVCLKGIWHSPSSGGAWYGHPDAINYWSYFLRLRETTQSGFE
ncbi:unnamed protein product [Agarophyton chilense]|eukprot:gb/GEZJ01003329.1/.p1 GENE.gb/GEZJ01003329.1/~~gb/GEZJ01003329.1/.p1  ORF type:complete len:349 (-),score=30.14 gb/GEZJ01003329.1/:4134-5180(-)